MFLPSFGILFAFLLFLSAQHTIVVIRAISRLVAIVEAAKIITADSPPNRLSLSKELEADLGLAVAFDRILLGLDLDLGLGLGLGLVVVVVAFIAHASNIPFTFAVMLNGSPFVGLRINSWM